MATEVLKRLFTVNEYHRMVEAGILTEQDRVELIGGEIIKMAAIGRKHAATVRRVSAVLRSKLGQVVFVDTQNPVELGEYSEPQPDITLLKPRDDFYASGHPKAGDVFLMIEVADLTVKFDRSVKIPLYAQQGVVEVWLVDLNDEKIEVYRQPTKSGYQSVQSFVRGQLITVLAFPTVEITIAELLGERSHAS